MKPRLTLRMDAEPIATAKKFSAETGKPVSRIVADFLTLLGNENLKHEHPLTPTVRSLKGILKEKHAAEKDYKRYIESKNS